MNKNANRLFAVFLVGGVLAAGYVSRGKAAAPAAAPPIATPTPSPGNDVPPVSPGPELLQPPPQPPPVPAGNPVVGGPIVEPAQPDEAPPDWEAPATVPDPPAQQRRETEVHWNPGGGKWRTSLPETTREQTVDRGRRRGAYTRDRH